jgi:hypothetical protein
MKTGKCCENALDKSFSIELTDTLAQDDYTYAILRSDTKKQVITTLTGTKGNMQLAKQGIMSGLQPFGAENLNMKVSEYFGKMQMLAKEKIKPKLIELQAKYPDYQYIFTGHSLGGAMSTIFALDSVLDGYVKKTDTSPVLINFASPRVGNFYFANQVMLNVPIIYRIVRNGDPVVALPACSFFGKCKNKLKLEKFSTNLSEITGSEVPEDKKYWHVGGLILYDNEMANYTDCGREQSENHNNPDCKFNLSLSVEAHTIYLGKSVSGICKGARKFLKNLKILRKHKKMRKLKKANKLLKKN